LQQPGVWEIIIAMSAVLRQILESNRTARAFVMGVLNVTPDSFSDGGKFLDTKDAIVHAEEMARQGADIIDVGAESTRPGSRGVSAAEQIARLGGILPAVVGLGLPVSIDTTNSVVAAHALEAGAAIINDVSAGRDDPEMLALAGRWGCPIVLMHVLGRPRTMQDHPQYEDVVKEVRDFLAGRIDAAVAAGVRPDRIIVDPGIGFGKTLEHNIALLAGIGSLTDLGCPVLVGVSRKRFIGQLTGAEDPSKRLPGTIAACLAAWDGGATIFRVHDVAELKAALAVASAVRNARKPRYPGT
jgi:dihydropteroate synthase